MTSTTPPPTGSCAPTTQAGRPGRAGVTPTCGAFSPDSTQLAFIVSGWKPPRGRCACWTRTPCSRRRNSTSPAASQWSGVDVQFSADGRYLAATVKQTTAEQNPREARGYAAVRDLRSPSTPPVRLPTGTFYQALALSPDGQILYTAWPLTAYDVATGKQIWRREDLTSHSSRRERQGDTARTRGGRPSKALFLVDAATGEEGPTLRDTGTGSATRGSTRWLAGGGGSPTVNSTSGTPPPAGDWNGGAPSLRGASVSVRTMTWSRRRRRLDAAHLGPVRAEDVSAADDAARKEPCCSRTPTSPRTGSRWPTAGSTGGTGWVRFADTVTGELTPPRACRCKWAAGPRHLASPGSGGRRLCTQSLPNAR